jgi:hypothetical protein
MADRLNSNAARFRATKHSRKRSCTSKIIYSRVQGIGRDKRRPSGPVARSTSRRCDEWPELHERHRTRRSQLVGAPAPKDRRSASGQPRRPMPRLVRREARAVRRGSRRLWSGGTLTPKGRAAGVFLIFGVSNSARDWAVKTPRLVILIWIVKTALLLMLAGALLGATAASFLVPPMLSWYTSPGGLRRGHKSRPSSKSLRSSGTRLRGCCWARPLAVASAPWSV